MASSLHILLVYTHMRLGGIETLIVRMANWLVTRGHKVTLLLLETGDLLNLLDRRVRVEVIGRRRHWLFLPFWGKRYLRGYNDKDMDVIYSFGPEGCYFASYVYRYGFRTKKPIFLNGIYHPNEFALVNGTSALDRMRIELYNTYISDGSKLFMSNEVRSGNERILGRRVEKSTIWPIPIDGEAYRNIRRNIVRYRIVSIGRYTKFKTYNLYMMDVVEQLVREGFDATWEVYGYGPLENEMRERVSQKKLENRVFIKGVLPYDKISEALGVAHVFVGMGTSLIEAGFCGVPSITAIADDEKGMTYGPLYDLPYYACGEVLSSDVRTSTVISAIRRIFGMDETEYRQEVDRTRQYVMPYSLDSLMHTFVSFIDTSPRSQGIDSYPGWKYASYCARNLYHRARGIFAVRRRVRNLIGMSVGRVA